MKRYDQKILILGTVSMLLGAVVACSPARRPLAVMKKQPTLKVALSGMNEIGNEGLQYHLSGCVEADGLLEIKTNTAAFTDRNLKKGLGGCLIKVTSEQALPGYDYSGDTGVLWVSDEFAVSLDENGLLYSEAKMERTYINRGIPRDQVYTLKAKFSLPQSAGIRQYSSFSGTLTCSAPLGVLHKNSNFNFDNKSVSEIVFPDLMAAESDKAVNCSELTFTAKLGDRTTVFAAAIDLARGTFKPVGNQVIEINQGQPIELQLRSDSQGQPSPPRGTPSDNDPLGVELTNCPDRQIFNMDENICQPCPVNTLFVEIDGVRECVAK